MGDAIFVGQILRRLEKQAAEAHQDLLIHVDSETDVDYRRALRENGEMYTCVTAVLRERMRVTRETYDSVRSMIQDMQEGAQVQP